MVLLPLTFEEVARRIVVHLAVALLHVVSEASLENASALKYYLSLSVLFSLKPLALVDCLIDAILTVAMTEAVFDFSFIAASIRPSVCSLAGDAIISEFALIDNAIRPCEGSLAVEETVVEIALISIAVLEGDLAGSVEAFSVYFAVLRTG